MNKQGYYVLWDTDEGLRYYKAIKESESDKKIKVNYEDNTDSEFFKKDLFTTKTNNLFNVLTSEQWAALTLLSMKGEGSPKREKETLVANTQEGSGRKRNLKTRKLKGRGGKKRKRKTRRKSRRKRRVKNRRKKTRKKRGRGMGTSKIAKVGVGALVTSSAISQGMGHGISPSKGTKAAVNHFKTVACRDFHIRDMVPHSEDHGMPTEHYRQVLQEVLKKKRSCKRKGQPMRNPNTGKPMSKKKQNQANKRRRARAKEKAKTRSKKTDTKNGRQGKKKAKNKESNLTPGDIAAGVGLMGTAAMVGVDYKRGRLQGRNNRRPRDRTPPRGQRYT